MLKSTKLQNICEEICNEFSNLPYDNGDLGDIGNEVGYIVSKYFSDNMGFNEDDFLRGIKHGISLNKTKKL